jgi:hypothetical protein
MVLEADWMTDEDAETNVIFINELVPPAVKLVELLAGIEMDKLMLFTGTLVTFDIT